MRRVALAVLSMLFVFGLSSEAMAAVVSTGSRKIVFLENGWYGEGFAVYLKDASIPNSCPISKDAPNQFGIDVTHPSYREMVSALLAAFLAGRNVELMVEDSQCGVGRTKVLSVRLTPPS
jgi:hypothetical protein